MILRRFLHRSSVSSGTFDQVLPITSEILLRAGIPLTDFVNCVFTKTPLIGTENTPAHSWSRLTLPFTSSVKLRERFSQFDTDRVRIGKVLEVLDAFSADIAYRHNKGLDSSIIVTACLDRMSLDSKRIALSSDFVMEGFMLRVGNSSADVRVRLMQEDQEIGYCDFLLVCRSPLDYSAMSFVKLNLITEEEKRLEERISVYRRKMKGSRRSSVLLEPPDAEESSIVFEMFRKRSAGMRVSISESKVEKVIVMHSQFRNIHGKSLYIHFTHQ